MGTLFSQLATARSPGGLALAGILALAAGSLLVAGARLVRP